MKTTRREIINASGVAIVSAALGPTLQLNPLSASMNENENKKLPIIDTHQHLWDLDLFQPPWLESASKVISVSHTPETYAAAIKGTNIVNAIYMEVDVAEADQRREAAYITKLCKSDFVTSAAVVSGRPGSEGFAEYVKNFKGNDRIKGIRQVLQTSATPSDFCLSKTFVSNMNLLGEMGLSFDLCMRPEDLMNGVKLAKQCPETRFIVDHCGNADPHAFGELAKSSRQKKTHSADDWKKAMGEFAQCENVICKISGIVARAPEGEWTADHLAPVINFCLDQFGPDRVVFGSDWPVCKIRATMRQWVESLLKVIHSRPIEQQKKLLHDNAVKFYGL